jgi:tetratricopeptide (TPR) repeat protein
MLYFLIFDVETTGLPTGKSTKDYSNVRIVQIAWQLYNYRRELINEKSFVIKPDGFVIPWEATQIHGISQHYAQSIGIPLLGVLNEFMDTVRNYRPIIIAHNIEFDVSVINNEFRIWKVDNSSFIFSEKICTMASTTSYCQIKSAWGYKWPKLEELYKKLFSLPLNNAHHALFDVQATSQCLFKLFDLGIISVEDYISDRNKKVNYIELLYQAGEKEKIVKYADKCIDSMPSEPLFYFYRGLVKYDMRDYDSAIIDFLKFIQFKPNEFAAHYNLGLCYNNLMSYTAAINSFNNALKIKPTDANSTYFRGLCYYGTYNYEYSYIDLLACSNVNTINNSKYYYLALTCNKIEKYDEAIGFSTEFLKHYPNHEEGHYIRGNAYFFADRYTEAINDFQFCIGSGFNEPHSYLMLGKCKYKIGDLKGAIQ